MRITLIGMAGAGKSTVSKVLAKKLNYKLIDIDKVIVKERNMSLNQIIKAFGEDGFIKIEEQAVLKLKMPGNCIISTGGSIIYSEDAMNRLKKETVVIFLDTPLQTIIERIKIPENRGLVGLNQNNTVSDIFKQRYELYKKHADIIITTDGTENISEIIKKISEKINLTI
ncbi:shikimate kinase [Methanosalsum natronophilum]|uniref:shikimate kinase n=1 Tax=Methanosalsum natronophilum TaxID=768733 RepID=UPI00216A6110|nr:shikimate kinase [Methanosalsum natronophilum]MCS3923115.1 shikimate kinase [Methanosalsum natronophilum]